MFHKNTFRNEEGAIDLASIMVGILAIGLIGGVIAATVFAVIPWTQDNAAKQQLDAVVAAQSAYKGLSSGVPPAVPQGHAVNSYADSVALMEAGMLQSSDNYCVIKMNEGASYRAFAKSNSGQYWQITDDNTKPEKIGHWVIPNDCGFLLDPDSTPTLTAMTYRCDVTSEVTVPIRNGIGTAKWSDGTETTHTGSEPITKTLTAGVEYTFTFDGTYPKINYQNIPGAECLRSLDHWGQETGVSDASFAFYNAINLVDIPTNLPASVKLAGNMFHYALSLNDPDISYWNVSNVTHMNRMFKNAEKFNQPLNEWNTSNVIYTSGMFDSAIIFDQPLNKWDVSNIYAMNGMFTGCRKFNQSLNDWDVSNVENMEQMFSGNSNLNQSFDLWDVSKVTNFSGMFRNAHLMQSDLSGWNTMSLTNGANFVPQSYPDEYLPHGTTKQA